MPDDILDLFALRFAGRAIAARRAAPMFGAGSAALPTAATKEVWRAGSIIATGNVRTGGVTRRHP